MKKVVALIFVIFLACVMFFSLAGCDNKTDDLILEPFTQEINTVDDFIALKDKVGISYSYATFAINSDLDLTGSSWESIGKSPILEEAFTGTIDGRGHTIKYNVQVPQLTSSDPIEPQDRSAYGLFGYANNAHFKDLNLEIDIDVPAESLNVYVGGLCAYLSGDSSITNINIIGNIDTFLRDLRVPKVLSDGSIIYPVMGGQENNRFYDMYAGGVIGYFKGNLSAATIASSVNINVGRNKYCLLNKLSLGGVFGIARPVDLSKSSFNSLQIGDIRYEGSLSFHGASVLSGGIAGAIHNATVSDVFVGETVHNDYSGSVYSRVSYGSVAGILEESLLEHAYVNLGKITLGSINTKRKVSFNMGGVIGQLKNSSISYCDARNDFEVLNGTYFYAGGLVGLCYDSDVDKSVSDGGILIKSAGKSSVSILDYDFKYSSSQSDLADYNLNSKNGGIAGRIEGQCVIGEVVSEFKAFQPIAGESSNRLEIVIIKAGAQALSEWINEQGYDINLMTIVPTESEDAEIDEQQYTINHFYKAIDNLKIIFREVNAKVYVDELEWIAQFKNLENTSLGTYVVNNTAFLTLQNEIQAEIYPE